MATYTGEGISATDTRHRDGFNKMVQDALDGKIDIYHKKYDGYPSRLNVPVVTVVNRNHQYVGFF